MSELRYFNVEYSNESGSFRPWVVSAGRFGLGRFGQFLGWVVSAQVRESFRPWVVSALSHFGPISIETEAEYDKGRSGCCW